MIAAALRDYEGKAEIPNPERARAKRADEERNRMRDRIERLPRWMREIEKLVWGVFTPIGGGT